MTVLFLEQFSPVERGQLERLFVSPCAEKDVR